MVALDAARDISRRSGGQYEQRIDDENADPLDAHGDDNGQQRGERPGRVRIVIQPQTTQEGGKAANQPCKPGSPLPLQPEKSLSRPTPAQPNSRKP